MAAPDATVGAASGAGAAVLLADALSPMQTCKRVPAASTRHYRAQPTAHAQGKRTVMSMRAANHTGSQVVRSSLSCTRQVHILVPSVRHTSSNQSKGCGMQLKTGLTELYTSATLSSAHSAVRLAHCAGTSGTASTGGEWARFVWRSGQGLCGGARWLACECRR